MVHLQTRARYDLVLGRGARRGGDAVLGGTDASSWILRDQVRSHQRGDHPQHAEVGELLCGVLDQQGTVSTAGDRVQE